MGFLNDDLGLHRFRSESEEEAIIIHLYSEKFIASEVYDPIDAEVKLETAEVDNNFDLPD
jgi:hypothetical protein